MNNTATVYGRPGCMKCRQTERKLAQLGLTVIGDLIDNYPNKVEEMTANGEMELPLAEATINGKNYRWTGFDTKNFAAIKELLQ